MKIKVNPDSPVPLYHQIAEAIRSSIAAGKLAPGDALQPMRQAAESWGVNIHTVRHAYASLAREGLVERSRGPRGTRILDSGGRGRTRADDLGSFLTSVRREAAERFGLGPGGLAAALVEGDPIHEPERPTVHIVECSEWQCLSHSREITSRYRVDALPWPLDRGVEPPEGPVISTHFHYNDVRRMWPRRLGRIHFLAIYPDPELRRRLSAVRHVIVCERDESTAEAVAGDLLALFGDQVVRVERRILDDPPVAPLRSRSGPPVLFAPRLWAQLPEKARSHPRALELRYVLDKGDLQAMGRELRWEPADAARIPKPDR